ncbi:type II toxin-antitoxin system HipA family toxin, partial [Vibrio sp. 10N.261.49.A5]
ATSVGFSKEKMQKILDDIQVELPQAIERLKARLPDSFPEEVSTAIFDNSLKMVKKLGINSGQ